jgi:hypothetical protein
MTQPTPGWYQDPTNPNSQCYWDGNTVVRYRAMQPSAREGKAMWWIGGAVIAVVLLAVVATTSTQTPTTATTTKPPTAVLPNVVGMTGYEGQKAIKIATSNGVLVSLDDALPVGCTKLAQGDAPIVRTDPLAGAELALSSASWGPLPSGAFR